MRRRTLLAELGGEPVPGTPKEFSDFVRTESPRRAGFVRRFGAIAV